MLQTYGLRQYIIVPYYRTTFLRERRHKAVGLLGDVLGARPTGHSCLLAGKGSL